MAGPAIRMLEALYGGLCSFARGAAIYLAVTLTVSSPVIIYYLANGAFTPAVQHWETAREGKKKLR